MALSPPSSLLEDTFRQAVTTFEASLTEKQRNEFRGCSLQDVEDAMRGIESRLASQRRQRNLRRISKFVEGLTQLGKVIELFVNVDCTVAFIWGPVKFLLLAAGTWVETLDCLLDTFAEIGATLPGLSQYGRLLEKHPCIGTHLQKYYCDVLEFHRKALTVFARPSWKTAFHSSWKTFKTQFGSILARMKRHRDLLSDEKITAAIIEVQDFRHSVEDKLDELSFQIQKLHIYDEDQTVKHSESLDRKRQFVLSKLEPPDTESDLHRASKEPAIQTSGDWLQSETTFSQWLDLSAQGHRSLYLNGIPGTGKTILAAAVVRRLQALSETTDGTNREPRPLVLYFFFKHHQSEKCTFVALLLSLIWQVARQDEVVMDIVYQRVMEADQRTVRSVGLLRELAETALKVQKFCFLVVDGLDECNDSRLGAEDAQLEVVDWLESLMTGPGNDTDDTNDRSVRLLVSAQRNGVLERRLMSWPAVQIDFCSAHMADIESYSVAKSIEIQQRFGADETARLDIVRRVTSRAKGMFLYAKIVLENLLRQPTRGHFKRELKTENFPKGLDQAYERVVIQILEGPDEGNNELARQILDLVICAERPLFWKEIQGRFCIDVEAGTADADFMLLEPCKKYCGSLVEVRTNCSQGSAVDEMVELVHETARTYLLHTGRFVLAELHTNMALFCIRYISSPPFIQAADEADDLDTHCLSGYYSFLDYAVPNWWKHVKQLKVPFDQETAEAICSVADSLGQTSSNDTTAVWSEMQQLQDDGREWERLFATESRVTRIRAGIETLFANNNPADSEEFLAVRELYGSLTYKCTKPWCQAFLVGFKTAQERDDHITEHERPFRCTSEGCHGSRIGFANQSDLTRHNSRAHSGTPQTDEFPPDLDIDIFKAAADGRLDVVQNLVAQGTSVNVRSSDGSTPLYLAAEAGRLDVCRWLLKHGARVNDRCTKRRVTALHAAVVNDDVELASLLIMDYGADVYARDTSGRGMAALIEKHRKADREPGVIAALPKDFWRHKRCAKNVCWSSLYRGEGVRRSALVRKLTTTRPSESLDADEFLLSALKTICLDFQDEPSTILHQILRNRGHGRYERMALTLLESKGLDCDITDAKGNLALHHACSNGYHTAIRVLYELTNFPHTANLHGDTPFDLLIRHNDTTDDDAALGDKLSTISWLLDSGFVDPNIPDDRSVRLALHRACMGAHSSIITFLLTRTKIPNLPDHHGFPPYHYAAKRLDLIVICSVLEKAPAHSLSDTQRTYLRIMERIQELDPDIRTRTRRSVWEVPLTHFGAYYLDATLVRITTSEASFNPPINDSSLDEMPVVFMLPAADAVYSPTLARLKTVRYNNLYWSPIFYAMATASARLHHHKPEAPAILGKFRDVADAFLCAPALDLPENLSPNDEYRKVQLLDECCPPEVIKRMAEAGLTLPWSQLAWANTAAVPGDDSRIYVFKKVALLTKDGRPAHKSNPYMLRNLDTVLAVVCSGCCRFVDIVRENFTFARDTVASGQILLGSLNLDSVEELIDLIHEHWAEADNILGDLIRLGLDGEEALWCATKKRYSELKSGLLLEANGGRRSDTKG